MSGVILRCPNCGTSRGAPGECDACHEAQVRYYCTNHKPGKWLDTPECPTCGAEFGVPMDPTPRPGPRPTRARPRTTIASPPPAPRADPPPSISRDGPGPWGSRGTLPSPDAGLDVGDGRASAPELRRARMLEILRTASRVGRGAAGRTRDAAPVVVPLGGCLMRFVLLVVLLFIVFMLLLPLVGVSLMQTFYF